jgi:hypothetical protein
MAASSSEKKIVHYGIDYAHKTCKYCQRVNHSKNTHCWYCEKGFEGHDD